MIHPILGSRRRLRIYLAAWVPVGGLLAALAGLSNPRPWAEALAIALPMAVVYAFLCLSAWFVCRSAPLGATSAPRLVLIQAIAAALSGGFWSILGKAWAETLSGIPSFALASERYRKDLPLFFVVGVLLFLLAAAVHYLAIAFEQSRAAERRALELQVLAREAELKLLRAQINPHFLFNSLNSISALAGYDPPGARRMCLLLADFLRQSLRLGSREEISLADELALVLSFLAIEQVRFGARLRIEQAVEDEAAQCAVPPLLLQPLVENAVSHGIAGLIEGGSVRIAAHVRGGQLEVEMDNPCEADAPARRGEGVGLVNVRARLAAVYGPEGRIETVRSAGAYRVTIRLPVRPGRASGGGVAAPTGTPHHVPETESMRPSAAAAEPGGPETTPPPPRELRDVRR